MDSKAVSVIPLNGANYPTWKLQCQMALMKDGLWSIVKGSETPPSQSERDKFAKFAARRDRALAIIVLSVEPSLLYLLGDPEDPVVVWKKLRDQFQKKTWANKLQLCRRLHSCSLKDGDSVQEHIKTMTEIFNELSVIGDQISEEDRVVYLLASLPDSYNTLVTALEANQDVPHMELVTERLLHEERKIKDRGVTSGRSGEAMVAKQRFVKKGPRCNFCRKFGHIQRNCVERERAQMKSDSAPKDKHKVKQKAHKAEARQVESSSSESESVGLVVRHALSASSSNRLNSWIVDSGATCHMCNNKMLFSKLDDLKQSLEVTLGDGHVLEATGRGIVVLEMKLPQGKSIKCKLHDVLYVPMLSYNLLSVSKVTEFGKTISFSDDGSQITGINRKLVATATRVGNLYHLNCHASRQNANAVESQKVETKEDVWHRRFGHLGARNLQKLAKEKLVDGFDYDVSKEINFCESCTEGKQHRQKFPASSGSTTEKPLDLVHSDVCGKINVQSLSGAEYFLTFTDEKTRYVWVYVLKHKSEVFDKFLEWKALVEKSSGQKVKALRTDNSGEYTSTKFESYLKAEGIRHEYTVPKTPEQNGVAERMNRTLVESLRSMLSDAKLPHKFWAEALATAVYLRNRSPTKPVTGMTPFEAWTGKKPNVKHLRIFGCTAYAHIPKDERQKLDSKSRKCILLGYGTETKGYRLYDEKCGKVLYSRDVLFNESSCGIQKESTEQKEKRYVYN